jgi:RimJ/RimL family protein N-acetyltransferase
MNTHLTKDGREFLIRRPTKEDAQDLIDYSRLLFASTDQVLTTLEEYNITLPAEEAWIKEINANSNALLLIAIVKNKIVGFLFFIPNTKRKNLHTGEFGVSVHPKFHGLGIGKSLVKTLLFWAKEHPVIEKIYLNVFATNHHAITLYKSLGFIEEGRHVKAAKQLSGEYVDVVQMYIELR